MLAMHPSVLLALALGFLGGLEAAPASVVVRRSLDTEHRWRPRQNDDLTAQQQAAQIPDGISTATDGSTILDTTVTVK